MCFRFYGVGWIKGQKLYADYEFLYSRHHKYFSNPEEARAAVELVLSKPERIKDFGRNFAFVGFDEVTGAIYVVKIDPRVKNKANHVRSVFEITAQQYQKYKLEASPVLQLSPTEDKQSAGRTLTHFMHNIPQTSENTSQTDGNGLERTDCAFLLQSVLKRNSAISSIS